MENQVLLDLLEEDRERVMAELARDRQLSAAQATLEKTVDRVMLRYMEDCHDDELAEYAQYLLQTLKNTLPMIDTVGEARQWKTTVEAPKPSKKLKPTALTLLLIGALLVLATVLGLLVTGRFVGILGFATALFPSALGMGCLFWAGVITGKPVKPAAEAADEGDVRVEYLVDEEKAWHCLRGAMLMADSQLKSLAESTALRRQKAQLTAGGQGPLSRAETELFASLLESAYASGDEDVREMASAIRFYLHSAKIDTVDYEQGRENWFEFLPAVNAGTIRPALASEGKLIKKGLASA